MFDHDGRFLNMLNAQYDLTAQLHMCSRAEVKGAVLACQEANFLHCYDMCHSIQKILCACTIIRTCHGT